MTTGSGGVCRTPSNAQPFQRLLEEELASAAAAALAGQQLLPTPQTPVDGVSPTLRHCGKLFIYLYKMATDSFDRCGVEGKGCACVWVCGSSVGVVWSAVQWRGNVCVCVWIECVGFEVKSW